MNNSVFGRTMENVRKHRDIKPATTERRKNYLVSERITHTTKLFTKSLLAREMNKFVYLVLLILDESKTIIDIFWYDYVKPKYGENAKLCYMDTDSFIVHVKLDYIYKNIAEDV